MGALSAEGTLRERVKGCCRMHQQRCLHCACSYVLALRRLPEGVSWLQLLNNNATSFDGSNRHKGLLYTPLETVWHSSQRTLSVVQHFDYC